MTAFLLKNKEVCSVFSGRLCVWVRLDVQRCLTQDDKRTKKLTKSDKCVYGASAFSAEALFRVLVRLGAQKTLDCMSHNNHNLSKSDKYDCGASAEMQRRFFCAWSSRRTTEEQKGHNRFFVSSALRTKRAALFLYPDNRMTTSEPCGLRDNTRFRASMENLDMQKNDAAQSKHMPVAVPLEDAPRLFGVSKSHIYRMSKAGYIDLRKVGRKTIVMTDTMLAYLGSLPPATNAKPE